MSYSSERNPGLSGRLDLQIELIDECYLLPVGGASTLISGAAGKTGVTP